MEEAIEGSLKFRSFASGSSGNCCFLSFQPAQEINQTSILIDAGVSFRRVKQELFMCGESIDNVSAILITHEHLDHIRALGSFCKYKVKPVYATKLIHGALSNHYMTAKYIDSCRKILVYNQWHNIGSLKIRYFVVPHDAKQTVGFVIDAPNHRFVFMTDLGSVPQEAIDYAKTADTIVIEANYDINMLLKGPYPEHLKKRILEGEGHLSNEACAEAIKKIYHKNLKNIFLCHLSENNNTAEIAYNTVLKALNDLGVEKGQINLRVLPRQYPSPYITL